MFRQENKTLAKKKSKSHGNRRLQRIKRKNRARGMNDATIQNLLCDHPPTTASDVNTIDEKKDEDTDQPMIDVSDQNEQVNIDDGSSNVASESGHR